MPSSPDDSSGLRPALDDLQVHQTGLAAQNDELRRTYEAIETARIRYADLYDHAPVGYLTINEQGTILEANLRFAGMLDLARSAVISQQLSRFIHPADHDAYYLKRHDLFSATVPQSCQVRMSRADGTSFWAELTGTPAVGPGGAPQCRAAVTDVTSQIEAEAALRASERFAYAIIDALSAHICVLDESGTIRAVNLAWRDFAAANLVSPANVAEGANYLAVCDAATGSDAALAAGFAAGIRAVMRGEQTSFSLEYPCHSPATQRWFLGRVSRVAHEGQTLVVVSHEDITARELIQIALTESEARYRAVVEDQTEVICRFSSDGTIQFVNDVYCRFFGKAEAELLDQQWQPQACPEDVPTIEESLRGMSPAQPVVVVENRVYSGTGELRWMQFVNRGFYDGAGQLIRIQSVGRDITERKLAEEALRRHEERYRLLVDTSLDGVLLTSPDGGILAANDAACRMLGQSEEDIIRVGRRGVLDALDPRLPAALDERARTGRFRGELTFVRKDGTRFPGEVSSAVFTDHEGHQRTSLVVRDVSARTAAAEELQQSRDRLRALAASLQHVREAERTRLAREIHDVLAQDLTRLKIDLAWLHGRLTKSADPIATGTLASRVLDMSRMADATIRNVQRIATDLRPAVLDSLGLCAAVEWQVREVQDRSGIACHVDLPPEDLSVGQETATAAFRIVQESLTNIQRHAKATTVDVSLCLESDGLVLRICDDGCGMEAEALTSPRSIGLIGMRERAALLGGHVDIVSQPGMGTTIEARLPLTSVTSHDQGGRA